MSETETKIKPSFINRELSWLQFNTRVVELAYDESLPLLERLKFLAISASNLDEFFMVRVGSLKLTTSNVPDPSGMTPTQQLAAIRDKVIEMNLLQDRCLVEHLEPALAQAGLVRLSPNDLNDRQREFVINYFREEVKSVISPTAITEDRPMTALQGAKLCLCIRLKAHQQSPFFKGEGTTEKQTEFFSLISVPSILHRMVFVPSDRGQAFILLEDVIGMALRDLFANEEIVEWTTLRVTRNADFALDDDAEDFFSEMEQFLELRAKSKCIRMRVAQNTSQEMVTFLGKIFKLQPDDVYVANAPLDHSAWMTLVNHPQFAELRDAHWSQSPSSEFLEGESMFDAIAERDRVLIHPYHSFDPVVEFLRQAVADPNVIAIKQTLYRTSRYSKIVSLLAEASRNGKFVTAVVELKARFDEARNMDWAEVLEKAGVEVIYGVVGFKVHAKFCIVVRREKSGICRYVHIGTGNYNENTATLYGDISLFTADPQIGLDAIHVMNAITGLSVPQNLGKLAMAPINLRDTILQLIEVEKINAGDQLPGEILLKLNSLVDPKMIEALYEASQKGVKVKINVRGICCLRPGVPGLSDNIQVVSILDRFLEHSRIIYFRHGGDQKVFISSADWMGRNLDRRIEILAPIDDPICRQQLLEVLEAYFSDNTNAWEILPDGTHRRLKPGENPSFRSQQQLSELFREQYELSVNPRTTVFKPILGEA
ncbi:MAG: polyphosphate kinase 1 [Pirellulaceae bacterium]|nr:polyphosphate kinase 1 [Pirellulaceae bacterium]